MAGYRRADDSWVLLIVLVVVICVVALSWVGRLVWGMLSEAFLVYKELGFAKTSTGKALRLALLVLVGTVGAGSLAASALPFTSSVDFTVMAWAFFGWTSTVAVCGFRGRSLRADPGVVDSYLSYGTKGGKTRR